MISDRPSEIEQYHTRLAADLLRQDKLKVFTKMTEEYMVSICTVPQDQIPELIVSSSSHFLGFGLVSVYSDMLEKYLDSYHGYGNIASIVMILKYLILKSNDLEEIKRLYDKYPLYFSFIENSEFPEMACESIRNFLLCRKMLINPFPLC